MGFENYSPQSHDFINYVLNKRKYLHALILVDSYLDHYAAWCYRTYYRSNKSKLKEYFKQGFKIKGKWWNLISKLPNSLPVIYEQESSRKYRYNTLVQDIKKFRDKRNIVVHEVMGLHKLFSKQITVRDWHDFNKRYKKDVAYLKKLKPLILEGADIVNRLSQLLEDIKCYKWD